jgi:transposase
MKIDFKNLPSKVKNLHQIIASLAIENDSLQTQNTTLVSEKESLLSENDLLRYQLKLLKAKRFGRLSEKLNSQIEQLELWIEENELTCAKAVATDFSTDSDASKELNKEKPKRLKFPEHLAREDVILNPEATCPECGGTNWRKIADDISETLEYIPSSFKVIRHIRPRCACIACEKIVQAYAPSKAIDKGKAGPGLLAHILIQKYCNHLPIYRQHQIYLREGIEIAQSTMTGWAGQCSRLLQPLIESLQEEIFSSHHIHGDDTPVKVLAPGLGKTKTGRIWTYVRDGRPYGETEPPAVCYFYSPDRKGERPKEHLKDFKGVLHADAYSGYDQLYQNQDNPEAEITEAGCWSHTRRKFYEITVVYDKASIAISILEQISEMYKIESEIRGLDPGERMKYRQQKSKELVEKLFNDFRKYKKDLPAKSPTAKAINYALNNEAALRRFLDDGKIEIDNNAAERAMRPIAVGRKNWMFAGSDNGGHTAAGIYSLIETAKMNNINPHLYLQKVLATIQDYNHKKITDLLPWNIIL